MIYILDIVNEQLIESEIVPLSSDHIPAKKSGWNFNWSQIVNERTCSCYALRTMNKRDKIEGVLALKVENGMLIMDVLELAPHNIGSQNKKFNYVAGCLIAFACRESFKIEGDYRGFLTFVSKTKLINWYQNKYGAKQALGQRMYIDWETGQRLIEEYLNRQKID
ncbi:hypothetical protein EYV94_18675 [Puteibacter caeruleilacunae]|nr:hypothetical protein EYV94_18675 [Puteibacter caeruleilacunae]